MSAVRLRVCSFKGSQNLPLYAAGRQGFFAARNLEVEVRYTAGSAPQIAGLARGEYDLIQTAPDNVVNANSNPAAFGLDPAATPRIVMLLGGSVGPLALCARPGIGALPDLRGAVLGVDNPTSGFALVLRDMLARAGLAAGSDYTLAVAGGTSGRLDALLAGTVAATILYPPYTALAEEAGCRVLATSTGHYPDYASMALAGLAPWVEAHGEEVAAAIAAILEALRWIHDPAQAARAREILGRELQLSAAMAVRAHAAFVDPQTGYGRDGALSDAGLRQVIALRMAAGAPLGPFDEPAAHLDLRWYQRAAAALPATAPDDADPGGVWY